jgi:hypothetical protein
MVLRMKSVLTVVTLALPFVWFACTSDTGSPDAGSGGRTGTGGTTGSGGAGAGGSGSGGNLGSGGAGGSGAGGRGTGGSGAGGRGTGGSGVGGRAGATGGAGGGLTIAQACTTTCNTQKSLPCAPDATTCPADCQGVPAVTMAAVLTSCTAEYTAMLRCEAPLAANRWTCSSDENVPIVVSGQCTASVCAWACCATDLVVPTDIWARCMATCN